MEILWLRKLDLDVDGDADDAVEDGGGGATDGGVLLTRTALVFAKHPVKRRRRNQDASEGPPNF